MKNKLAALFLTAALFGASIDSSAQLTTPRPSPGAKVVQTIGLSDVSVSYSRPGVKERTIFGGLVPFDKLWRTGANAATYLETAQTLFLGDQKLEPGKYSIFTIPGKTEWKVMFNSDWKASTSKYDESKNVVTLSVKPETLPFSVETFTISFQNVTSDGAELRILWEKTMVSIGLKTETDKAVMASIEKTMKGVSARDYYVSASYYFDNGKDINKAVEWINKAVEMKKDKPQFWVVHKQALILAKSGDIKGAIAAAEHSKKLAEEAKYEEYVRKNDKVISEWKSKK